MSGIENTTRTSRENPMAMFAEALMGGDRFVENQEARGQAQVVASQQLPAEGDWEALEALGFVKGEPVPGDDLFVNATIPEGWYKEATEHSMYSVIKDERGIERVTVGYKAAFYDRWARITIKRIGWEAISDLTYGEGEMKAPDYWSKLTELEREQALSAARKQLAQAKEDAERMPGEEYWTDKVTRNQRVADFVEQLIIETMPPHGQ